MKRQELRSLTNALDNLEDGGSVTLEVEDVSVRASHAGGRSPVIVRGAGGLVTDRVKISKRLRNTYFVVSVDTGPDWHEWHLRVA